MDVFRNSQAATVRDGNGDSYTFASFQRGDEARLQLIATYSSGDEDLCVVEISAEDAGRLLECLKAKSWEDRFETAADQFHFSASRRNSADPYSEGFRIEVSEIEPDNGWSNTVFGGYFEDGYYLDSIIEVLQHCVDLDQKLKATPTP